jgi:hypothetical protein
MSIVVTGLKQNMGILALMGIQHRKFWIVPDCAIKGKIFIYFSLYTHCLR